MSIRGTKFKRHQNYHIIDHLPESDPTKNYLVDCPRCQNRFIVAITEGSKVRCMHCRASIEPNNPHYYSELKGMWSDKEIKWFNNQRPMHLKMKVVWTKEGIAL